MVSTRLTDGSAPLRMTTTETPTGDIGARLESWLAQRLGNPVRVTQPRIPEHGGMSSVSVLFDAEWTVDGQRHDAALIARLAPEDTALPVFPEYDLARQFDVMTDVGAYSDVPVPRVRWFEESPAVLGSPFLVMDRVSGSVPGDNPPYVFGGWLTELGGTQRQQLQDASVDVLADIHRIPAPEQTFGHLASAGAVGLRAHFENERRYYEWTREEDGLRIPVLEDAFDWLAANWPEHPSENVLCWGDARIGNILYDGVNPAGVLDWELAWLGPRELDVGWFLFFHHMFQDLADAVGVPGLPGMFRCDDVVARYEHSSGVTLRDLRFYMTYAALRHGIVMSRIHRRRIHFGEVDPPDEPNEYVLHHKSLAELIDGTYEWRD